MSNEPIKCSNCKTPSHVIQVDGKLERVECTGCGAIESYDKVVASLQEQAGYYAAIALQKGMKGNKHMTFKPGRLKKPTGKFFIDF